MSDTAERVAKFFLDEPNATAPTKVHLIHNEKGKIKYYTGERVTPSNWDKDKRRVIDGVRNGAGVNTRLNAVAKVFTEEMMKYEIASKPFDYDAIKDKLETAFKPEKAQKKADTAKKKAESENKTFFTFIQAMIDDPNTQRVKRTLDSFDQTLGHLKDYAATTEKKTLDFEDIDLDFYGKFCGYLNNTVGLRNSSVGIAIQHIKTFLNDSRRLHSNLEHKDKKFKILLEESDTIYLTEAEIENIYRLDLSYRKALERARDVFVCHCYLGLRYSDLLTVRKEHIRGNMIFLKTTKTANPVAIPLYSYVRETLDKYSAGATVRALPVTDNGGYNAYIKEIGKLAGLDEMIEVSHTSGTTRLKRFVPKYELITSHTARRSFATNLYLDGVDTLTIRSVTGHKTEKSFLRYIRVSPEQHAQRLADHWGKREHLQLVSATA